MQSAKHAKHANGEGLARRERGQKARTTQSRFCSLFSCPLACLADLTSGFEFNPSPQERETSRARQFSIIPAGCRTASETALPDAPQTSRVANTPAKVAAFSSAGLLPGGSGALPASRGLLPGAQVAVPRGDGALPDAAVSSPAGAGVRPDAEVAVPRSDGALPDAAIPSPVATNALPAAQNSPNGAFRHADRQNFPDFAVNPIAGLTLRPRLE